MGEATPTGNNIVPTIVVNNLSYKFPDGSSGLTNISLDLPAGSRTLLIGGKKASIFMTSADLTISSANGAGKTTSFNIIRKLACVATELS